MFVPSPVAGFPVSDPPGNTTGYQVVFAENGAGNPPVEVTTRAFPVPTRVPLRRSGEVEFPEIRQILPTPWITSNPQTPVPRIQTPAPGIPVPLTPVSLVGVTGERTPVTVPVTITLPIVPRIPVSQQTPAGAASSPETEPAVVVTVPVYNSGPVYYPGFYYPPGSPYNSPHYPSGLLVVTSDPSKAFVTVDGDNTEITPFTYTALTPGYHTVEVDYPGYEAYVTNVYLENGGTASVNALLISLNIEGSLFVQSTPEGADLFVDGNYNGITPATVGGSPRDRIR